LKRSTPLAPPRGRRQFRTRRIEMPDFGADTDPLRCAHGQRQFFLARL